MSGILSSILGENSSLAGYVAGESRVRFANAVKKSKLNKRESANIGGEVSPERELAPGAIFDLFC